MPLTAAQRKAIDTAKLDTAIANLPPNSDASPLYKRQADIVQSLGGSSSSSSALPLSPGAASDSNISAIGSVAHVDALAIVGNLTTIDTSIQATNALLSNSLPFVETIWKDSTNTYFIRSKKANGSETFKLLSGANYVPVGASVPADASVDDIEIERTQYTAATTNPGYSIGDRLVETVYIDLTTTPETIRAVIWRNLQTGLLMTIPPTIGVDAVDPPDNSLVRLDLIYAALGTNSDPIASDDASAWSIASILRRISSKLPGAGTKNSLDSVSVSIAGDDAQIGTEGIGISPPIGGYKILGYLSGIFDRLGNKASEQTLTQLRDSTTTLQTAGNNSLSSIDTKLTNGLAKVQLIDSSRNTYVASTPFGGYNFPSTNATDIFSIITLSAKIIRITRIGINIGSSTTGRFNIALIKRSGVSIQAVNGSFTLTPTPMDSNNPVSATVVKYNTINPITLGTQLGILRSSRIIVPASNALIEETLEEQRFGEVLMQPIVLRVNESLCVNLGNASIAGGVATIWVEWTEE